MDIITIILLFLIIAFLITVVVLYFTGSISKEGPTGPAGINGINGIATNTGATGPTGPSESIVDYANIYKTLTTNIPYQINSRDTVLWDDPTTNGILNGDIHYNASIPGLTIPIGTYLITYGYSNVTSTEPISLSLQIGSNMGPNLTIHGISTSTTGQSLSVIRKITAPTFITVINTSSFPIVFQDTVNPGSVTIYMTVFRLQ